MEQLKDRNADRERELTVQTGSPTNGGSNSAEVLVSRALRKLGTPSYQADQYFQTLRDDFISSVAQLREFDEVDWRQKGFKAEHIRAIQRELNGDEAEAEAEETGGKDGDEEDDDLDFDDDSDDGWDAKKSGKSQAQDKENNESTTDFDDF